MKAMKRTRSLNAVLIVLLLAGAILLPTHLTPTVSGHALEGRMTGGGSIFCDLWRVTHGFELHCDNNDGTIPGPNNLQINWGGGNNFHLTRLVTVDCINDPTISERPPVARFDTITGTGIGRFNNEPGATIRFRLTDAGEPGTNDTARFVITDAHGNVVLDCTGDLDEGNHQAHRATGNR